VSPDESYLGTGNNVNRLEVPINSQKTSNLTCKALGQYFASKDASKML